MRPLLSFSASSLILQLMYIFLFFFLLLLLFLFSAINLTRICERITRVLKFNVLK